MYTGVLGQCGCRGPETVDRLLGRRKALGGQRDQLGHGRIYLGECELCGDEARLQARCRQDVRKPRLGVVPAFAWRALAVAAASAGEHDEVASAEQTGV